MLRRTKFPSVLAGRLVVNKWWPTNFERIVLSNLSRGHCSKMSCACAVVAGKKISETWEGDIIRWTCQCRRRVDSKVWSFSAFFLGFHEFMPYNEPEKIDWHVREEVLVSQSGYVTCTTKFAETESFSRAFLKSKLISTCPFSFFFHFFNIYPYFLSKPYYSYIFTANRTCTPVWNYHTVGV